jgi:hypothetical protein
MLPYNYFWISASLTTIPPRIETECKLTIDSLLSQVDEIIVSIPLNYRRFNKAIIPEYFFQIPYAEKVKLNLLMNDFGPATKYIGSVDSDGWIFVCDDDQEYSPVLISRMFSAVKRVGIYQNHYEHIRVKTSGGIIHGYVGNLVHSSLIKGLKSFSLPESAYFVDDQWMSIYCFKNTIPIYPSGIETYSEIFKVLQNNHEKLGTESLSGLNNRDEKVAELAKLFRVKFIAKGEIQDI